VSAERRTTSGIEIRPLYGPADAEGDPARIGEPGAFPFTRGLRPDGYRTRPWTIRQYAGFGTPQEANERFRFLLAQGQPGLSVAFDLPTQMGMDSDDARALGEVGRVGVAIDTLDDVVALFDGIPLDAVSTSMTINAPAPVLVAMYVVAAELQGVPAASVRGTAQNDVL
jgi:methylmalonyl-CoA mutase N-terminal domain/subunit